VSGRIRAVVRKELRDLRRNRFVVGSMVVLPVLFLVLPIGNVLSIKQGVSPDAAKAVAGSALLLTSYLVPLLLPTVVAGYAVIGEREQGTLEPVLTTPIRPHELLLGKALAAVIPTVTLAYALFAAFMLLVHASAAPVVASLLVRAPNILAEALAAPLLATFSIWVGLAISARSTDVRVAQQLAALSMLPMVGLVSLFTFGVVSPTFGLAVAGAIVLAMLDVGAWRLVSLAFDRERLLTRYGRT
jgi:ABC-type Na+ efflux pump permease subunit